MNRLIYLILIRIAFVKRLIVTLGQKLCHSPDEIKSWSQNLGHEDVLTTLYSYGHVQQHRQGDIFQQLKLPRSTASQNVDNIARAAVKAMADQVGIKMACNAAREVQQDFVECQGRKISASFLQNFSRKVAGIAAQQETLWHYDLPNFLKATGSITISLDGICMLPNKEGWREAMAGKISFYHVKGERQHTIYLGATPEYGKAGFLRCFTAEIERIKACFPNAKRVGLADGA